MSDNRSHLEPLVQQRIEHFAYPNAGGGACGEREEAIAAEVGFVSAVTTRSAPLTTAHRSRPLFLPRIGFPARETIAGLGGRAERPARAQLGHPTSLRRNPTVHGGALH